MKLLITSELTKMNKEKLKNAFYIFVAILGFVGAAIMLCAYFKNLNSL